MIVDPSSMMSDMYEPVSRRERLSCCNNINTTVIPRDKVLGEENVVNLVFCSCGSVVRALVLWAKGQAHVAPTQFEPVLEQHHMYIFLVWKSKVPYFSPFHLVIEVVQFVYFFCCIWISVVSSSFTLHSLKSQVRISSSHIIYVMGFGFSHLFI